MRTLASLLRAIAAGGPRWGVSAQICLKSDETCKFCQLSKTEKGSASNVYLFALSCRWSWCCAWQVSQQHNILIWNTISPLWIQTSLKHTITTVIEWLIANEFDICDICVDCFARYAGCNNNGCGTVEVLWSESGHVYWSIVPLHQDLCQWGVPLFSEFPSSR